MQYAGAGSTAPPLTAVNPLISTVLTSDGAVTATWSTGREAVSAVLMRDTVQNEFILDAGTQSQTDWIVTFPTKHYFVGTGPGIAPANAAPFANNFHATNDGSCDFYDTAVFNREEQIPGASNPVDSGLPPVTTVLSQICWQANVIPFSSSSLLASINSQPLVASLAAFVSNARSTSVAPGTPSLRGLQGPNGWFMMKFNSASQVLRPVSAMLTIGGVPVPVPLGYGRHEGMPVIGTMLHNYLNTGVASRYGGVIDHRFTNRIN